MLLRVYERDSIIVLLNDGKEYSILDKPVLKEGVSRKGFISLSIDEAKQLKHNLSIAIEGGDAYE